MDEIDDMDIIGNPETDYDLSVKVIPETDDDLNIKAIPETVDDLDIKLIPDVSESKPAWSDYFVESNEKKLYDRLDITKIIKEENKLKKHKIKAYSAGCKKKTLLSSVLNFRRCTDGNHDYPSSKHISFAICHPHKQCLLTGSEDKLLGVFKVDGEYNKAVRELQYFERFPIKGGRILPDGKRLIFHSKFNSFQVFDLNNFTVNKFFIENNTVIIRRMEVSPVGDIIVFSSNKGIVYIVSTKSFDVIDKVTISGKVRSMAFSHMGKYLYIYGDRGIVFVYDFPENGRAVFCRQWIDEGSMNGSSICVSKNDEYLACGSSTSVVNIYHLNDTWKSENPQPIKTVENFGRVNLLTFNNASEILAMGSSLEGNSQRLVNLGSMKIISNFPGTKGMQRPTSFSFSPNDKYLAVGQSNGKVAMYSFDYYAAF